MRIYMNFLIIKNTIILEPKVKSNRIIYGSSFQIISCLVYKFQVNPSSISFVPKNENNDRYRIGYRINEC